MCVTNTECDADFRIIENLKKDHTKSLTPNNFAQRIKVENSEFASHLSFYDFFLKNSLKTFSTVPKAASNSAFLDHISIVCTFEAYQRMAQKPKESRGEKPCMTMFNTMTNEHDLLQKNIS